MQRRVAGAALTVVGILMVLFVPVRATDACAVVTDRGGVYGVSGVCGNFSANSLAGLVNWPAGWEKLFVPMVVIGTALAGTGARPPGQAQTELVGMFRNRVVRGFLADDIQGALGEPSYMRPGVVPAVRREGQADLAERVDCLVPGVGMLRADADPPEPHQHLDRIPVDRHDRGTSGRSAYSGSAEIPPRLGQEAAAWSVMSSSL